MGRGGIEGIWLGTEAGIGQAGDRWAEQEGHLSVASILQDVGVVVPLPSSHGSLCLTCRGLATPFPVPGRDQP